MSRGNWERLKGTNWRISVLGSRLTSYWKSIGKFLEEVFVITLQSGKNTDKEERAVCPRKFSMRAECWIAAIVSIKRSLTFWKKNMNVNCQKFFYSFLFIWLASHEYINWSSNLCWSWQSEWLREASAKDRFCSKYHFASERRSRQLFYNIWHELPNLHQYLFVVICIFQTALICQQDHDSIDWSGKTKAVWNS